MIWGIASLKEKQNNRITLLSCQWTLLYFDFQTQLSQMRYTNSTIIFKIEVNICYIFSCIKIGLKGDPPPNLWSHLSSDPRENNTLDDSWVCFGTMRLATFTLRPSSAFPPVSGLPPPQNCRFLGSRECVLFIVLSLPVLQYRAVWIIATNYSC